MLFGFFPNTDDIKGHFLSQMYDKWIIQLSLSLRLQLSFDGWFFPVECIEERLPAPLWRAPLLHQPNGASYKRVHK